MNLLFLAFISLNLSQTGNLGEWTHPFGNMEAHNSAEFLFTARNIQNLYDYDSIVLPEPMQPLLCGDISGNHINQAVGLSMDKKTFYRVDFTKRSTIPLSIPTEKNDTFSLCALTDADHDQALDILYTRKASEGKRKHESWSFRKNTLLFSIPSNQAIDEETAFTLLDANFDQKQELLCIGSKTKNGELQGVISLYDCETQSLLSSITVPAPIPVSAFAVKQDFIFEETYIIFATDYSLIPNYQAIPGRQCILNTYVIAKNNPLLTELWTLPLRPGLIPARLCTAKTIDGDTAIVTGTRLDPSLTATVSRAITRLSLWDGSFIDESPLPQADCLNLAVANMDDDEEDEVIYFESQQNLHILHFSENRDRIFGMPYSYLFVGVGVMHSNPYPECPAIQKIGPRCLFHLLDENLDPKLSAFSIRTSILDKPILGDIDGNGRAEVIWVSNDSPSMIHRLGFFDPDSVPAIKNWKKY